MQGKQTVVHSVRIDGSDDKNVIDAYPGDGAGDDDALMMHCGKEKQNKQGAAVMGKRSKKLAMSLRRATDLSNEHQPALPILFLLLVSAWLFSDCLRYPAAEANQQ